MKNHTYLTTYRTGSGDVDGRKDVAGAGDIAVEATTATADSFLFRYWAVQSLAIKSTVAATVQFKDAGNADLGDPIELVAGVTKVVGVTAAEVAAAVPGDPAAVLVTITSDPQVSGTVTFRGKFNPIDD